MRFRPTLLNVIFMMHRDDEDALIQGVAERSAAGTQEKSDWTDFSRAHVDSAIVHTREDISGLFATAMISKNYLRKIYVMAFTGNVLLAWIAYCLTALMNRSG